MRKALIFLAAFFCAACSNYSANLPSIKPYKMDIQQGNHVTSKMMMQLRPGMTKSQVRFVMGTPLIADSFHANRWDYLYRMVKAGKIIEQRHVILVFENDQLKRVRGDVIPAGSGDVEPAQATDKMQPKSIVPNKPKEKGLMDKLKFWKSDEEAPPATTQPESDKGPLKAPAQVVEPVSASTSAPVESKKTPSEAAPDGVETSQPATDAPSAEPVKPAPVRKSAPQNKPASTPSSSGSQEPAKAEAVAPAAADDLPPEDDPGYFERMLEKIGF